MSDLNREDRHEKMADDCLELLINSAAGIYIPEEFINSRLTWQLKQIKDQTADDTIEIIKDGPDHEAYWDCWDEVLNVEFIMPNTGKRITLHQSGDLWAVKTDELEKYTGEEIEYFWDCMS